MDKKFIIPHVFLLSFVAVSAHAENVAIECENIGSVSVNTDTSEGIFMGESGPLNWSFDGVWLRVIRDANPTTLSVALSNGDMILNGRSSRGACRVLNPDVIPHIAISRGAQARIQFLSMDDNDKYNVQVSLSILGLYLDSPDGLWGRKTEEAVVRYYDGLSQSDRDSIDLGTPDGASRVLQMILWEGTEGDECDGCEDTVVAEEMAPLPRLVTEPQVSQPSESGNGRENRQEDDVQRVQREIDDFVRGNVSRVGEISASCDSSLFKILGMCVSQSYHEQMTVLEGRGYNCVASASLFGAVNVTCKSGQAEVTFHGDRVSMNCYNFNTCGMDISTVAQKLVDGGVASRMTPDIEYGTTLMGGSNIRQSYCENGDSGDRLCVVSNQNEFTAVLGSEIYIDLMVGNYRPDGGGSVSFD